MLQYKTFFLPAHWHLQIFFDRPLAFVLVLERRQSEEKVGQGNFGISKQQQAKVKFHF